jgi:hypothetical protein
VDDSLFGYHTFCISLRLNEEEGGRLLNDFRNCKEVIRIPKTYRKSVDLSEEGFRELNISPYIYCLEIVYPNTDKGIRYILSHNGSSPRYYQSLDEEKAWSIKAIINPKLFTGIKDYVTTADERYLEEVRKLFDIEVSGISPILKSFNHYSLNRVDYCINFDIDKLKMNCTKEQMMILIKRSNIPRHYNEITKYDSTSHRQVTYDHSFYLKNNSVAINCYDKHYQLNKNFLSCPNIEESLNVIRFEIQCKYQKVHNMSKPVKMEYGKLKPITIDDLLSDDTSERIIRKYYNQIIRKGDYYTLDEARHRITNFHNFNTNKRNRLISTLEYINQCRGITKAMETLQEKDLLDFRRTLKDLDDIRINPVTIPRDWNIKTIPNLITACYRKVEEDENNKRLEEYNHNHSLDYFGDKNKCKNVGEKIIEIKK